MFLHVLHGKNYQRHWKHFFDIMVHGDMIAEGLSSFLTHPKVSSETQIGWLGRPLKDTDIIVMFMESVWENLCIVTWHIIKLDLAIISPLNCGSNNTQTDCGVWTHRVSLDQMCFSIVNRSSLYGACAHCSHAFCSWLTEMEPEGVSCCWCPSALGLDAFWMLFCSPWM